ncbi:glycosyltransferase family 2 protein [Pedobacter frigiditerrae]|uniref:glycosyltransferase family 2 protein n=1 Tax=Pedobacter frigiditerrae TaxID=2530452 RepID=UPI00292DF561|nr:glycosyltransferase family 2 protein [Pedobacter frigiditerrae]
MPKVSIIVPNFNHAPYLKQRIDSVLNQTYQDFELIIMDDFSTDNSRDIINHYASCSKVSNIIYNEKNSGNTFKQWKKGVSLAVGDYIWIAESDDWCEPTLLQTLVDGIEKDPNCAISYCQSYCVTKDDNIRFQSSHNKLSEIVEGKTYIQQYLSVPIAIFNASMALWKRDLFHLIPDELTSFKFCGDWYFWINLCKHGNVHISGKLLNYFRKHENDVSGKAYQSGLNFIEELKIISWLYQDSLITENIYYKAFKKKYIEYWRVKTTIPKDNRILIKALFRQSLSTKTSLIKLTPIAIFKTLK